MPRRLPPPANFKVWTELLPAEGLREHGRHIYMFRHVRTNQVVYTLYPRVIQRTLNQLPFIGKHSKPASVRADHWTAYCRVGPFPSPRQGISALKKLREFRKVHELSWDKTNPEWKKATKKGLITRIMDQRENSVADLAKVLSLQESQAEYMSGKTAERKAQQEAYLQKKWNDLEALARSIDEGAIQQLEKKIRDCKSVLGEKKADQKEVARLNEAMANHRRKIKELLWAQHMVRQRDEAQEALEAKYVTAVRKTTELKEKLRAEGRSAEADAIPAPEKHENAARTQFLPKALKSLPQPFQMDGIECHWKDLQDAESAESWPETLVHDTFAVTLNKRQNGFITVDEAKDQLRDILNERAEEARAHLGIKTPQAQASWDEPAKTGIWKYVPNIVSRTFSKRPSV